MGQSHKQEAAKTHSTGFHRNYASARFQSAGRGNSARSRGCQDRPAMFRNLSAADRCRRRETVGSVRNMTVALSNLLAPKPRRTERLPSATAATGLFVVGTDTGVGKTYVASRIVAALA